MAQCWTTESVYLCTTNSGGVCYAWAARTVLKYSITAPSSCTGQLTLSSAEWAAYQGYAAQIAEVVDMPNVVCVEAAATVAPCPAGFAPLKRTDVSPWADYAATFGQVPAQDVVVALAFCVLVGLGFAQGFRLFRP